jgi:glycosyltransferase involved in cell wall biosynthesis
MMAHDGGGSGSGRGEARREENCPALFIATILREEGVTGVHTHVREFRRFLSESGQPAPLVTPFDWGGLLTLPVFGLRPALEWGSRSAGVAWYRHWHELFLRNAMRRDLAGQGDAVIYAQGPEAARACLDAREGPHQRVVMGVHYTSSQADGWVEKGRLERGSMVYHAIRRMERDVIPRVDGLVYVSRWAQESLVSWLPEAADIRSAIIPNFVRPIAAPAHVRPAGDLVSVGSLEPAKNHQFILEVLAESKAAGHSFTLDLFGDGPLRKPLERSAQGLGIERQVRFRGYRPDVRTFLPGYRAYVHACHLETGPLAIIEAMAAGLPVLAPNSGGPPELFDEGVEGRFWPVGDPEAAAAVLINVVGSEARRSEFAAGAFARFQRQFAADLVAPQPLSFLMAGSGAAPGDGSPASGQSGHAANRTTPASKRP